MKYQYNFVTKKEFEPAHTTSLSLINDLQDLLRPNYKMDRLVTGSGKTKLVTKNVNGYFDIDWNLVITYDINNEFSASHIRKSIFNNLQSLCDKYKYYDKQGNSYYFDKPKNHKRSIYINCYNENNELCFRVDIAIYVYDSKWKPYILILDKNNSQKYIWNPDAEDVYYIDEKITEIKKNDDKRIWDNFRKEYLKRKYAVLRKNNQDNIRSISILRDMLKNGW